MREDEEHRKVFERIISTDQVVGMFVAGYATSLVDAARRGIILQRSVGLPSASLVVSWATGGTTTHSGALGSEIVHAIMVKEELIRLLEDRRLDNGSFVPVCHSRGCGVLFTALYLLGKATLDQRLMRKIRRIIMISPEIDTATFVTQHDEIAKHLSFGISVYGTSRDVALKIREFGGGAPVGSGVLEHVRS